MPSVSGKQHRLMAAVANNPAFAKRVNIPQSVGQEYMKADEGKSFKGKSGGAAINTQNVRHGELDMPFHSLRRMAGKKEGGPVAESKKMMKKEVEFMKKKGAPKSMIKHEEKEAKYAKGGGVFRRSADGVAQRGKTKGKMLRKGGSC